MDETLNDGGPAFPCEGGVTSGLNPNPGMSLRDWFAGQALAGMLNRDALENWRVAATDAYHYADAMLAERARGGQNR